LYAGGGGGAQYGCNPPKTGGMGGAGFYNKPITQPFSQPYSVGAGGNPGSNGNSGGATNLANVGTANGGNGAPSNTPGNSGTQPGANLTIVDAFRPGGSGGAAGNVDPNPRRFTGGSGAGTPGLPGGTGLIVVYENTGT
jgi:hypothetical protein